jgi:hypothetical protein
VAGRKAPITQFCNSTAHDGGVGASLGRLLQEAPWHVRKRIVCCADMMRWGRGPIATGAGRGTTDGRAIARGRIDDAAH